MSVVATDQKWNFDKWRLTLNLELTEILYYTYLDPIMNQTFYMQHTHNFQIKAIRNKAMNMHFISPIWNKKINLN